MLRAAGPVMQELEEPSQLENRVRPAKLRVSAIVPVRNEAHNLPRCLESLRDVSEVWVIDSDSTD